MIEEAAPVERFEALDAIAICRAAFVKRVPGIEVTGDKAVVLRRLDAAHRAARASLGMAAWPLLNSHQVHGDRVAVIDSGRKQDEHFAGYDGFITNQRQIAIGVHVADCCAVYIVDPNIPAIGLVHSGKKGTELAIAAKAIEAMHQRFGSEPSNLVVQHSPCIRPSHY